MRERMKGRNKRKKKRQERRRRQRKGRKRQCRSEGKREREGKAAGRRKEERKSKAGREGKGRPVTQRVLSLQESKGYDFESETDTETIAKLVKYMYDNRDSDDISFTTLVERVIQQLVMLGAGTQGQTHAHRQTDTGTKTACTPVLPRVSRLVQHRLCHRLFCSTCWERFCLSHL